MSCTLGASSLLTGLIAVVVVAAVCAAGRAAEDQDFKTLKAENARLNAKVGEQEGQIKHLENQIKDLEQRCGHLSKQSREAIEARTALSEELEKQRETVSQLTKSRLRLKDAALVLSLDVCRDTLVRMREDLLRGLGSPKESERQDALKAIRPEDEDLEALFPGQPEEARKRLLATWERQLADGAALAAKINSVPKDKAVWIPTSFAEPTNASYRQVLDLIPERIPIFSYASPRGPGEDVTWICDFGRVNGRWICVPDLAKAHEVLRAKP